MTAPAWATDLTNIYLDGAITSWTAIGGGPSGLTQETDYYIEGSNCVSKAAWTNAIKGMIYDNGASFTVPTDGAVIIWGYYSAPNSLATTANGGLQIIIGSGSGAYYHYYIGGNETLTFDTWVPYAINPDNSLHDNTTGSPTATEQFVGGLANLPTTSGPTKGAPLAWDALRYGRATVDYTFGDVGNGYNTFSGAEGFGNDASRRWGLIEQIAGVYRVQGFHRFGITGGDLVDFRDSNKVLFIRNTTKVTSAFNRFEIQNASSNVEWTNIIFQSLSTVSKGTFVVTAGTLTAIDCQFIDLNTFTFLSSSTLSNCTFRRCGQITAPGTDMTDSTISGYTGAADTSALVWDVATDPDGYLDNTTHTKGTNAHHAIELGTNSPLSMTFRGLVSSGYNATNAQNDSFFHVKRTTGSVTLNLVGTSGNFSYKTDGATVTVVSNPVTTSVTVRDNVGALLQNARVLLEASDGTGDFPYEESVTITRSGSTASVSHTTHGLVNNDWVVIRGANEPEYNGPHQITNVTTNAYDYTVSGTPASPATGTIISSGAIISGLTNASGLISASRTFSVNQPLKGKVRKSTSSPRFKDFPLTGTINNSTGLTINVRMVIDE